jgi:hypothetical protein
MRTTVPEKLLAIADDIAAQGDAPLTRLTVLKKWFERPGRLAAFGAWAARRAAARKGKTRGEAGELFDAARALLGKADPVRPGIDRSAAAALRERLYAFQSEYQNQRWGRVRIIRHWNLLLVEKGLDLVLRPHAAPTDGYKLAADYCQNYDPRYGNALNGPSRGRVMEIVRFMFTAEALEDEPPPRGARRSP